MHRAGAFEAPRSMPRVINTPLTTALARLIKFILILRMYKRTSPTVNFLRTITTYKRSLNSLFSSRICSSISKPFSSPPCPSQHPASQSPARPATRLPAPWCSIHRARSPPALTSRPNSTSVSAHTSSVGHEALFFLNKSLETIYP